MTVAQLSARARLTLLYTGLVAVCGTVLVTVTYLLVAHNLHSTQSVTAKTVPSESFMEKCLANGQLKKPADLNLKSECLAFFNQGAAAGAQAQRDTTLTHLLGFSVSTLAAVTILAALAGWILAGRILRPIHQLTAAARAASEHTLSHRLALSGPRDELRELADTFDDMLGRLDAAFASQRHFIANASHELRTPLTVMRTSIEVTLAKQHPTPDDYTAMGADVRNAVDHAEGLIDALLTLARNERGLTVHEPVDLAALTEDVLETIPAPGLTVATDLEPAVTLGDPILLERLIANLIDNAVRYNVPDGSLRVVTACTEHGVTLCVINTGPVIPADRVPDLFEPFTRLNQRTSREGFGLGLALVSSIAAIHAATLTADAPASGGLHVRIRWPADGHSLPVR